MTHMMLNEDTQDTVEAYRADLARLKLRDEPEYFRILNELRGKSGFHEQDQDALTALIAVTSVLIDELDAGTIE